MTVDVNVSKYLLADYYWPAFRASIRDGKAKGVMCSCEHQPDTASVAFAGLWLPASGPLS